MMLTDPFLPKETQKSKTKYRTSQQDYPEPYKEFSKTQVQTYSHSEFMNSLQVDDSEEKVKIERKMNTVFEMFKDCGDMISSQDFLVQEIDKTLKIAEENSKQLVKTLKKANQKASCQQRLLNSIIISLLVVVIILISLIILKSI